MALGWMTALKLVPWSDVIEATPKIVKGAKRLFTSTRAPSEQGNAPGSTGAGVMADDLKSVAALGRILQARVETLEEEQHASAELIASLAEQNAEIIRMVETLRYRARLLTTGCSALLVGLVALAAWVLLQP